MALGWPEWRWRLEAELAVAWGASLLSGWRHGWMVMTGTVSVQVTSSGRREAMFVVDSEEGPWEGIGHVPIEPLCGRLTQCSPPPRVGPPLGG